MKKLLKPSGLLLYLLTLIVSFFSGMLFAAISGAAKGQGLAGGAVVFGYGVIFAIAAFIAALFLSYYAEQKTIVVTNRILAIVFVIFIAVFSYLLFTRGNAEQTSLYFEDHTTSIISLSTVQEEFCLSQESDSHIG